MRTTAETTRSSSLIQITTKRPPTRFENRLQTGTTDTIDIDVRSLELELRSAVRGEIRRKLQPFMILEAQGVDQTTGRALGDYGRWLRAQAHKRRGHMNLPLDRLRGFCG